MAGPLVVNTERLKRGEVAHFDETLEPRDIWTAEEGDPRLPSPIGIKGKVYCSGEFVVGELSVETIAWLVCSICEEDFAYGLSGQVTLAEPLPDHSGIFDLAPIVAGLLLTDLPEYAECSDGKCPKRKEVEKFMGKGHNGWNPFDDFKE